MGTRYFKATPVTYSGSGTKFPVTLSRAGNLREIYLRLTGAPTLTLGNNTVANTGIGDEWSVVQRIDVIANNNDVLFSMSGNDLFWYNFFAYGTVPRITPTIGDAATANPSFDSVLIIPFWSPNSARPMDTVLRTTSLSDLRVEVTWGNFTDVNSAATAWTANPIIQITGYYDDSPFLPPFLKKLTKTVAVPPAAQTDYRIDLPVIAGGYRRLIFNSVAAGSDSSTIITNLQLVSGSTIFSDFDNQTIQQALNMRAELWTDIDSTSAVPQVAYQRQFRRNTKSNFRAWYFHECCPDGYLSEAINTSGLPEFFARLNVSATATINILSEQLFPLAQSNG